VIHPFFNLTGEEAKGLLFGLLEVDKGQLRDHPEYPPFRQLISDGKIRYEQHDPGEKWQSYRELMEQIQQRGYAEGDCEDFAPALAASDQVHFGVSSTPYAYSPRDGLFHVVTAVPSAEMSKLARFGATFDLPRAALAPANAVPGHELQDPSAATGMPTSHFGGVGKPMSSFSFGAMKAYNTPLAKHGPKEQTEAYRRRMARRAEYGPRDVVRYGGQETDMGLFDPDLGFDLDSALDDVLEEETVFGALDSSEDYGILGLSFLAKATERLQEAGRRLAPGHAGRRIEKMAEEAVEALEKGNEQRARRKVAEIIERIADVQVKHPDYKASDEVRTLIRWFKSGKTWASFDSGSSSPAVALVRDGNPPVRGAGRPGRQGPGPGRLPGWWPRPHRDEPRRPRRDREPQRQPQRVPELHRHISEPQGSRPMLRPDLRPSPRPLRDGMVANPFPSSGPKPSVAAPVKPSLGISSPRVSSPKRAPSRVSTSVIEKPVVTMSGLGVEDDDTFGDEGDTFGGLLEELDDDSFGLDLPPEQEDDPDFAADLLLSENDI
jgi:hypothetical protein